MLLVLDSTSRTLRAKMSDTPSSVQCSVTVTYADTTATTFVEGMYPIQLNGTTLVTILPAPTSGTRRVVKSVMFFNDDTMTHTITLYLTDNITDYPITKISLPSGASWASDDQTGVNVGGAVTDGSKGDISVSNGGDTWTIANSAVTLAKMADIATDRLIGRDTAGTGVPEAISVTGGIEFTGSGSLQVGAFSGEVSKTAGDSTLTITNGAVVTARIADSAVTPAKLSSVAQALSFRNRLINGNFSVDQRNDGAATNIADDVYCLDRWYVLSQTNTVNVSRQTNSENGSPTNIRLTQNQSTAQRCGIAQIIESINCRDLRGESIALNFRVRCSSSQAIRYAVLEWTGTLDAVTSDVVNSWTNGTFTTGQFFNSTSLTLVGTGSITPSASTWTSLTTALTGTVSSSMNNLIVFIWSEGTLAQNATLDLSQVQLERGTTATTFERVDYQVSLNRCRRYCLVLRKPTLRGVTQSAGFDGYTRMGVNFPVELRASPTVSMTGTITLFDGTNTHSSTAYSSAFVSPQSAELVISVTGMTGGRPGLSYIDAANTAVIPFVAEL